MSFVTYAHTKPDGTIFYIGKGVEKRAYDTKSRNRFWKHIVAKHGFKTVILANWDTEQEAFEHEKVLIACFNDMGYELANLTDGGEGSAGYKWAPEQLAKRSTEEARARRRGENNPMFGKRHSEELKEKISLRHSGKNNFNYGKVKELNKKYKGPVLATNIKTGEQLILEGSKDIESKGFNRGHIASCLNGKRKTHNGFTFKRVEKDGKETKDSRVRHILK
jgi:hypothetical protein